MFRNMAAAVVVLAFCLGLCLACSNNEETERHFESAGHSIEKAYDSTTNALKDVVEGVNDAVYD